MNFKRLKLMRSAARVIRVHTMPTVHTQSNGEHTFGVIAVLLTICHIPSPQLLRAAVFHDAAEAITGDVPSMTKIHHPKIKEALTEAEESIEREFDIVSPLTAREKDMLKYCDMMELALFATEETDMGNKRMAVVIRNALWVIRKRGLTAVTPAAKELYEFISKRTEDKYPVGYGEDCLNGWPEYKE